MTSLSVREDNEKLKVLWDYIRIAYLAKSLKLMSYNLQTPQFSLF